MCMNIPERIRAWRDEKGMTAEAAGKLLNVSQATWTRYETGDRTVGMDRMHDLAKLTGISAQELRPDLYGKLEAAQ